MRLLRNLLLSFGLGLALFFADEFLDSSSDTVSESSSDTIRPGSSDPVRPDGKPRKRARRKKLADQDYKDIPPA